jgi:hypothetical protein
LPAKAQRWVEARRVLVLALAIAAVTLAASACGHSNVDSNATRREILRSPHGTANAPSFLYFQVKGPAGAVSYIADRVAAGGFSKFREGFFLPPRLRHHLDQERVCDYARTIGPADSPKLQAWRGRKVTIVVYGKYDALLYCRLIGGVFTSR